MCALSFPPLDPRAKVWRPYVLLVHAQRQHQVPRAPRTLVLAQRRQLRLGPTTTHPLRRAAVPASRIGASRRGRVDVLENRRPVRPRTRGARSSAASATGAGAFGCAVRRGRTPTSVAVEVPRTRASSPSVEDHEAVVVARARDDGHRAESKHRADDLSRVDAYGIVAGLFSGGRIGEEGCVRTSRRRATARSGLRHRVLSSFPCPTPFLSLPSLVFRNLASRYHTPREHQQRVREERPKSVDGEYVIRVVDHGLGGEQ